MVVSYKIICYYSSVDSNFVLDFLRKCYLDGFQIRMSLVSCQVLKKKNKKIIFNKSVHVHSKSKAHYRLDLPVTCTFKVSDFFRFKCLLQVVERMDFSSLMLWKVTVRYHFLFCLYRLWVKTLLFHGKERSSSLLGGRFLFKKL